LFLRWLQDTEYCSCHAFRGVNRISTKGHNVISAKHVGSLEDLV
jgi:hypothetical protein